jgi:tetratricopeptide (TPR) repeat protein
VFWTYVSLGWVFAGLVVLVAILGLGLRLNRKKSTAHLAMRLAEAYRREGDFETARRLYELAPDLDQNVEQAREGKQRAEQGIREPVLAKPLVEAALRRLLEEREVLADHLEREGIDVELPPIEEADPRREPG